MSELADILGRAKEIEFGRRKWSVKSLTFNDLCDLEERFGDVDKIDLSRAASQRFVLWLILRRASEGSAEITEHELGDLLTLDEPKAVADFILRVFELSGLTPKIGESKTVNASKNARTPQAAAA